MPLRQHLKGDAMSTRYRLKASISAVLISSEDQKISTTIPVGAILHYLSHLSVRLGTAHVFWEGKEYAISEKDLHQHTELADIA